MQDYPLLPVNIGEKLKTRDENGQEQQYLIADEIVEMENNEKAVYMQQLEGDDGQEAYRFVYWIIGRKGRVKGQWVIGQMPLRISEPAVNRLWKKAFKTGWFQ